MRSSTRNRRTAAGQGGPMQSAPQAMRVDQGDDEGERGSQCFTYRLGRNAVCTLHLFVHPRLPTYPSSALRRAAGSLPGLYPGSSTDGDESDGNTTGESCDTDSYVLNGLTFQRSALLRWPRVIQACNALLVPTHQGVRGHTSH